MPGAVTALADIGVAPAGRDLVGIRYLAGHRAVEAPFRSGLGRGVRRTTLHAAMRSAAEASGVALEQRGAREVRPGPDGSWWTVERFRYVVAADGLHSPVRRLLGLDGRPAPRRRYGLRRHYRLAPWTSYVEVHWAESVEAYVTPVADDVVGVALLTSERGSFDDHLTRFPSLAAGCVTPHRSATCSALDHSGSGPGPGWPGGCCSSGTPAGTSTPSPAKAWRWPWRRLTRPLPRSWTTTRCATSATGTPSRGGTAC
jgi:2-polyprenyl-6-methoxyphenol hydroxylase-like FAD-dependent oxidoreductase